MKKLIIILSLAGLTFAACSNSTNNGSGKLIVAPDTAEVKYQCPMKCQGDTAYTTAGQCPVCGMDLMEMEEEHHHK